MGFQDICNKYQSKNIDDSLPKLNLGNGHFNVFNWQDACELFSTVEKSEAYLRTYNASMFKGVCQLMLGNADQAHETMNEALKSGKNDAEFKSMCERYTNNAYAGFWETLIDRNELFWSSQDDLDKAQALLKEFQSDLGINAQDRGETQITKKYKHSSKTKESNRMLYHFVQANLDKHNKITASAIKHFTIICENLKPKSSLEKIMLWQSHLNVLIFFINKVINLKQLLY